MAKNPDAKKNLRPELGENDLRTRPVPGDSGNHAKPEGGKTRREQFIELYGDGPDPGKPKKTTP